MYPTTLSAFNLLPKLRRFDVLIAHRYPMTVCCYIASRIFTNMYIYWFHHVVDSSRFKGLAKAWIRILHYLEVENFAATNADMICAVSETSKADIQKYTTGDVYIVPNSIDQARFNNPASITAVSESFEIDFDKIVLFVGRITPQKNIRELVEIFKNIKQEEEEIGLVIAGSYSDESYVEEIMSKAGENIVFTGYISDSELGGLYELADVFATCSSSEGWSLTPAEAKYFDLPVIAYESNESARAVGSRHLVAEGDRDEFKQELQMVINCCVE
ncbi:MAG: glycosyltransferase family 4 protein [Halobacteriaceae archaeon]